MKPGPWQRQTSQTERDPQCHGGRGWVTVKSRLTVTASIGGPGGGTDNPARHHADRHLRLPEVSPGAARAAPAIARATGAHHGCIKLDRGGQRNSRATIAFKAEMAPVIRFAELIRTARNLRFLADIRDGNGLNSVADLIDNMIDSPQMDDCLRRFRQVPGGAEMLDQRYPIFQPEMDQLMQLPTGSLGRTYAELLVQQKHDPYFFRKRPVGSENEWLTQRIASTHDIHHVVSGFSTTRQGEVGVLAVTSCQIGFPIFVLLSSAAILSNFRRRSEHFEAISAAVAHGMAMGRSCQCLAAVRWEEGLERSVQSWRDQLGIMEPADSKPYGLHPCGAEASPQEQSRILAGQESRGPD